MNTKKLHSELLNWKVPIKNFLVVVSNSTSYSYLTAPLSTSFPTTQILLFYVLVGVTSLFEFRKLQA